MDSFSGKCIYVCSSKKFYLITNEYFWNNLTFILVERYLSPFLITLKYKIQYLQFKKVESMKLSAGVFGISQYWNVNFLKINWQVIDSLGKICVNSNNTLESSNLDTSEILYLPYNQI